MQVCCLLSACGVLGMHVLFAACLAAACIGPFTISSETMLQAFQNTTALANPPTVLAASLEHSIPVELYQYSDLRWAPGCSCGCIYCSGVIAVGGVNRIACMRLPLWPRLTWLYCFGPEFAVLVPDPFAI